MSMNLPPIGGGNPSVSTETDGDESEAVRNTSI